ncbi:2,5-diketo-D-gluconate reductase B [Halogranum amylolyticum]|uniref:2,5-diketo-D-gluconate reductase B n=1 Tax=Halogranum amylolyticum TaxID=660520 RepID=A0A1H8NIQ0_9EURY|nr:aldo/keto reductase [Halogranum amylolyticum]SEO29359.1 2,5-diketo-D-gluconate reductase B [Halogranum amylolyticum]
MDDPLSPIGLGTMGLEFPTGAETVATALDVGYRHLDTAQIYHNEHVVGAGVAGSDIDRDEVFLATKVWADSLTPDAVLASTQASLARLGVDAVDLLYVHRPIESYDPDETLPAFDALVDAEKVRHVGVSNFTVEQLDTARETLQSPLFAHQTEYHPLFQRPDLVEHARRHDYTLVAYSPLAGGKVFDVPELQEVAAKHDTTEAAVSIAWLSSMENVVVVPKASSEAHLRANFEAQELELDDEDVAAIEAIDDEVELYPE